MSQEGGENRGSATSTTGEEVWKTMYSKLVEEKNAAAETNQMYMKMLEACAEQNNIAERQATSAKKEAEESQNLALEADEQRKNAVIALQKTETEFSGKLNEIEAKSAETIAELASQLDQAQTANAQGSQHLNSEVQRLTGANLELRNELCVLSGGSATIPRKIVQKGNEVRCEMSVKLAEAHGETASAEQRNKNLAKQHAAQLKEKQKNVDQLGAEITALKENVLSEQQKRATAETEALEKLRAGEEQAAAYGQEVQHAKQQQAQVQAKLDSVLANAEGELQKQGAQHGAAMRALEQAKAASENQLNAVIQTLTEQSQKSNTQLTESNAKLQGELDASNAALAQTKAALAEANAQLQQATSSKNQGLKDLRDKMLQDAKAVQDLLKTRSQELKNVQAEYKESLKTAKTQEAEMENVRRSGAQSLERQHAGEGELEEVKKALVDTEARFVDMQRQLTAKDSELLALQENAGRDQEVIRNGASMNADRMAAISARHQEEMASMKAGLTQQLAQATKGHAVKASEMATEVDRLQNLVGMNADHVHSAAKTRAALDEAEASIANLQQQLAAKPAEVDDETPVGKKRRKK